MPGRPFWDQLARVDPLWAVLSDPRKSNRRWDLREFMQTGEREIALLIHQLRKLGLKVCGDRALDFGCGVGRLTQALARRFAAVTGVDVSPEMLTIARRLNWYGDRATYVCNSGVPLQSVAAGTFDLIYSNIALQHVESSEAVEHLIELFHLMGAGSVMVFQLPSHHSPPGASVRPMPESAYRAVLETDHRHEFVMPTGGSTDIWVRIRNRSDVDWVQRNIGSLRLGNHWMDAAGELMLVQDDGRTPLPDVVPQGGQCVLRLQITAPAVPGRYAVSMDLVHEGISWFEHKGNAVLRLSADVEPAPDRGVASEAEEEELIQEFVIPEYDDLTLPSRPDEQFGPLLPEFPMHGVPYDTVIKLIRDHGLRLVHVEDGSRAGSEWADYRYFIEKP